MRGFSVVSGGGLEAGAYLHPLGEQLGVLGGLLLVLQGALPLQGDAVTLVLQHTGGHQSLDPGSLGSGLLTWGDTGGRGESLATISAHVNLC